VGSGWELARAGRDRRQVYLRVAEKIGNLGRVGAPIRLSPVTTASSIRKLRHLLHFRTPTGHRRKRAGTGLLVFVLVRGRRSAGRPRVRVGTKTPMEIPKPLELTSQAELMLQFT